MTTSIEIEVESEKCEACGQSKSAAPEQTKDQMLTELKALLNDSNSNGMAERQMKIDELMTKISEMGSDD